MTAPATSPRHLRNYFVCRLRYKGAKQQYDEMAERERPYTANTGAEHRYGSTKWTNNQQHKQHEHENAAPAVAHTFKRCKPYMRFI